MGLLFKALAILPPGARRPPGFSPMLVLQAPNLASIAHGFFGRQGGVSGGLYASLNCGPGSRDLRDHVEENRHRVRAVLGAPALVTLYQIHSADAVTVDAAWQMGDAPRADAMATNRPGIALGILTADCAPVLLADPQAGVIGAAHAGWKGAVDGVIAAAVAAMVSLGASRDHIRAAIGPCISQANYEVGPEFRARFVDGDARVPSFLCLRCNSTIGNLISKVSWPDSSRALASPTSHALAPAPMGARPIFSATGARRIAARRITGATFRRFFSCREAVYAPRAAC